MAYAPDVPAPATADEVENPGLPTPTATCQSSAGTDASAKAANSASGTRVESSMRATTPYRTSAEAVRRSRTNASSSRSASAPAAATEAGATTAAALRTRTSIAVCCWGEPVTVTCSLVTPAIVNFPDLAGSESPVIGALPWLLVVAVIGGLIAAAWMRSTRPQVWANLSAEPERFTPGYETGPTDDTRESVIR